MATTSVQCPPLASNPSLDGAPTHWGLIHAAVCLDILEMGLKLVLSSMATLDKHALVSFQRCQILKSFESLVTCTNLGFAVSVTMVTRPLVLL